LPIWALRLATVVICNIKGRRATACVLAVDAQGAVLVLWSDGELTGYTVEEWESNLMYQINSVDIQELQQTTWDMKDPQQVLVLLDKLQPGSWQLRHASNLANKMLGGTKFNPFLVITDRAEVSSLLKHLKITTLRKKQGIDPFAGLRTIPIVFQEEHDVKLWTNELNKTFPSHYHLDAINPSSYATDKLGKFDYCVTSIPFAFADIAIPLLSLTYEAIFLHCPSWYLFQGSRARHQWIKTLAAKRCIFVLHVNEERNKEFGKYAVWIAIFKTRDLANLYFRDANKLFEDSLPCLMG
jgi:hypothetical protein